MSGSCDVHWKSPSSSPNSSHLIIIRQKQIRYNCLPERSNHSSICNCLVFVFRLFWRKDRNFTHQDWRNRNMFVYWLSINILSRTRRWKRKDTKEIYVRLRGDKPVLESEIYQPILNETSWDIWQWRCCSGWGENSKDRRGRNQRCTQTRRGDEETSGLQLLNSR